MSLRFRRGKKFGLCITSAQAPTKGSAGRRKATTMKQNSPPSAGQSYSISDTVVQLHASLENKLRTSVKVPPPPYGRRFALCSSVPGSPLPGDICWARIVFSDARGSKVRPALVLAVQQPDLVLAEITSHIPRNKFDVALTGWRESGLLEPSCVRCQLIGSVSRTLVHDIIGHIMPQDWRSVSDAAIRWFTSMIGSEICPLLGPEGPNFEAELNLHWPTAEEPSRVSI